MKVDWVFSPTDDRLQAMQRYRINYFLLGAIFLASVLIPPPLYFIWKWRVESNATWFHKRGEAALAEGKLRDAAKDFSNYVKLRGDEDDVRIQLAHVLYDITEMVDATNKERRDAYGALENTVRRTLDPGLRKKFIDFQIKHSHSHDAIGQIDVLLLAQPNNHELKAQRAKCLFLSKNNRKGIEYSLQLIGYDEATDTFDVAKAQAADQPEVYANLAGVLYATEKKPEFAERVIQQMMDENPESHVAHFRHSIFLYRIGKKEASEEALAKAYELDPTDRDVLMQKGIRDFNAKRYEEASKLFTDALKKHPDHAPFYHQLAESEVKQKRYKEAIQATEKGISFFGKERAIVLQRLKIRIFLMQKDFPAIEEQLQELTDLENPRLTPLIDFERARVQFVQEKWSKAKKALESVRPKLHAHPSERALAGIMLGKCCEQLGQRDTALAFYNSVLQNYPNEPNSLAGVRRIEHRLNPQKRSLGGGLNQAVQDMLEQPEEFQDWEAIAQRIDELSLQMGRTEAQTKLLHANVMAQRKKFGEARKLVTEAFRLDSEDIRIVLAAIQIIQIEPDSGPEKAIKLLDKKTEEMGDQFEFRMVRANLLMAIKGEQVSQQLQKLTEGMEAWDDRKQSRIWSAIGSKFQQLNNLDEARACWTQAAELLPNDLPVQVHLFEIALSQGNDEAMHEAQKRILAVVDEKDSSYILTEVKRRLVSFGRGETTKEEIQESRKMLDDALVQRPNWHELHVLYGQLLFFMKEDSDLALKRFEDALQNGPPNINGVAIQIRLLAQKKRFVEAAKLLELIPVTVRSRLLGRIESDVLLKAGEKEAGFLAAQRFASTQPKNSAVQSWFSKIAQNSDKSTEAEASLRTALEKDPHEPRYWLQLIGFHVQQRDNEAVESVLREAHLALNAEYLPLLTAKAYELRGRWQDAERLYLSAYEQRFEEVNIARKMATFYLLWVRKEEANRKKAAPYINRILKAANEGRVAKDQEDVVWARQTAARILSKSKRYQDILRAQKLLRQGNPGGQLSSGDRLIATEIYRTQRDPASKVQAIDLMFELLAEHKLDKNRELQLAHLLHQVGQQERSEKQILDMLSRYGADPNIWAAHVDMLIDRGEYDRAAKRLSRLEELKAKGISLLPLKAKLASNQGNQELLRKTFLTMLPRDLHKPDEKQLATVLAVANLAAQLDDQELAEQLYRLYVKRVPEQKSRLVNYLAIYGNGEEALNEIKRLRGKRTDDDLRMALHILQRRKEFGDKFDEDVLLLIRSAVREDPESAQRQLMLAEALEITEKFDQSVEAYQQLLQKEDLPDRPRASAMNNLAFLYALKGQRLDEAEQLVDQAIEIFGPISAALDTRAIVRIAQKRYDSAVEDMELAVMVGPTDAKYFHLAQAQLLAGKPQAALAAWDKAVDQGLLEQNSLHPLEKGVLEKLSSQIEELRAQNAGL